ncbi:glutamate 5-kinase [Streptococcus gallolyticus]|uniref:glutamate 5-kinase n=1 Tax=Streptococcus gallolyticus TaxID=315405 RepID=UPI002283E299|nr:glutamate 5-kinase [Streptococcus gallolyticus]MCY7190920.1 glutamate 5-kinase [Streptococcus gallolyticus subsp. gallolyticus]
MKGNTRKLVIKIGTSTLTDISGRHKIAVFEKLAHVISAIHDLGYEVVLVSSGAVAVGRHQLAADIASKQAAAAVGQYQNVIAYEKAFAKYDKMLGQVLVSTNDFISEEQRENFSQTLEILLKSRVIPIVNENDVISDNSASQNRLFTDNDMLAAIVATLCRAQKLIILSDIDGLYDKNPRGTANAKLIQNVKKIDDKIISFASGAGSNRGTGGMITKLKAAKFATNYGVETIITNGNNLDSLYRIIRNEPVGTTFQSCQKTTTSQQGQLS